MTSITIRTISARTVMHAAFVNLILAACAFSAPKNADHPKPKMDMEYFFKMPRAWVEVISTDEQKHILKFRTRKGEEREMFIRPDTSLRVRDSFGELSDYYPGESVMLFICPDDQKNWVFPRAVQDELEMMSAHGWKWTVDALDRAAGTVDLSRKEQSGDQQVVHESFRVSDMTKVWKGEAPGGLDTLKVGDIVLFQTRYDAGQEKRFVVEFFDDKGLAVVKAAQEAKHLAHLQETGWPAIINDVDLGPGTIALSVVSNASKPAKEIKMGDKLTLERGGDPAIKLTASVLESGSSSHQHKFLLLAKPAEMVRLQIGELVQLRPVDNGK